MQQRERENATKRERERESQEPSPRRENMKLPCTRSDIPQNLHRSMPADRYQTSLLDDLFRERPVRINKYKLLNELQGKRRQQTTHSYSENNTLANNNTQTTSKHGG